MFERVKFPANAAMLNAALIKIASFNLIDTGEMIDSKIYEFPDDEEAFNINFKECGYESTLLLKNSSLIIWTLTVNAALFLLFCITRMLSRFSSRLTCCIKKLSVYFFWNGLIRLFMEVFFEIAFASSLNLYTADWNTSYFAVKYSNILSSIFCIGSALITIFLIIFYSKNLSRIED